MLLVAVRLGPRGAVFGNLLLGLIYLPCTVAGAPTPCIRNGACSSGR